MILKIYKIFSLLILWLACKDKWYSRNKLASENVLSDRQTLTYLKKNPNVGIIRYGNSELGLIVGNSPKTQKYNKKLRDKLINNCRNYNPKTIKKYLLALPLESLMVDYDNTKRNLPKWYPGIASKWAMRFLVKKNHVYGSPFCFRTVNVDDNNMKHYLSLLKSLFIGRKIIYVGPMQGKNKEIPHFMSPSEILKIPKKNAFEKFDEIVTQIKILCSKYRNPLVVIVGGTTASVISYELNMSNITCYDFGQYQRLYTKYILDKKYKQRSYR